MRVDPNNRLVADSLEAQWNEKLRVLADTREDCEKQQRLDAARLTQEQKTRIRALAGEFPKLWSDPKTHHRDRKRMARLLLEDVTLRRDQDCLVQLRSKGGATHQMRLPLARTAAQMRKTSAEVVARIDSLLKAHSESDVATILNQEGWRSGEGHEFTLRAVRNVRYAYSLKSHCERLRQQGWMTVDELAAELKCEAACIKYWRSQGLIPAVLTESEVGYLYQKPSHAIIEQIRQRQLQYSHKPISF